MKRHPLLLLFLPLFSYAQTCDLTLAGYTPSAVEGGIHTFVIQFPNAENCGCNDYTQADGNTCEQSGSTHVQNNESVTHLVMGIHYVDEETGLDLGENTDCTSTTFHPGWSYVLNLTTPPGGWVTGMSTTIGINVPYAWECILNNPIEGYCWEVVIWQINLSQTATYDDFADGWSAGTQGSGTQMYPDVNISDNRITFCPDPVLTDTVYVYETDTVFVNLPPDTIVEFVNLEPDTVFVELPPDTITLIDTLTVDNYIEVYVYDTTYIDNYIYVMDTVFTETTVYDTTYVDVVVTEYVYLTDTVTVTEYSVVTEYIDCDSGLPCEEINGMVCEDVDVFIPNASTPNHDGINDLFYAVTDADCWREWELNVYNRWGQVVWTGYHPDDMWDASGVADGSYVYSLRASKRQSSAIVNFTGHVIILK